MPLTSVNWHVWPFCNYQCDFCFMNLRGAWPALSLADGKRLLRELRVAGMEKITFVGGEPTLGPDLPALLTEAKSLGLTTMIVTNGTRLDDNYLSQIAASTDWIAISIDSADEAIERAIGRGRGDHVATVRAAAARVHQYGIGLKVNTVVTRLTWEEDMRSLLRELRPQRWKVFQYLPITGENDAATPELSITDEQFRHFLGTNAEGSPVGETNDDMTDSYIMIDPLGRFIQNSGGRYQYSRPILDLGVATAFREINFSQEKQVARYGIWDWERRGAPQGANP